MSVLALLLMQDVQGDVQLFSVYVPTNHIYVGDVFLLGKQDIIKVNLSVREGLGKIFITTCITFLSYRRHRNKIMHVACAVQHADGSAL